MNQDQIKQYVIDACRTEKVPQFWTSIVQLSELSAQDGSYAGVTGMAKTRLLHSALGMMTEIAELETALANEDRVNVLEELGDVAWYWAIGMHALDVEIPDANIRLDRAPSALAAPYLVAAICLWGDIIRRHAIHGKELDYRKAHDALLDLWWELRRTADSLDIPFDDVFTKNIAKLKARFPEKYDAEKFENRDLDAERKVLES